MSKIELKVVYDTETGRVEVTGPIHDKIMSYGLMEMCREIISKSETPRSNIVVPNVLPLPQQKSN
jgi:hypothetical protein